MARAFLPRRPRGGRAVTAPRLARSVRFALGPPAVGAVNFPPAVRAGRYFAHDPRQRVTIPDVVRGIDEQTDHLFMVSDFVPVPR